MRVTEAGSPQMGVTIIHPLLAEEKVIKFP